MTHVADEPMSGKRVAEPANNKHDEMPEQSGQGNSSPNYHITESNTLLDKIVEQSIQGHASTRDAIRWAMQQEREACAKLIEADGLARGDEGLVFIKAAGRIRARSEKPPVKSYCGGKPNYCTPEPCPPCNQDCNQGRDCPRRNHD